MPTQLEHLIFDKHTKNTQNNKSQSIHQIVLGKAGYSQYMTDTYLYLSHY